MFEEYTGIKDAAIFYRCGDCTKAETGACASCAEDNCNAIAIGEEFDCDDYEFKDNTFTKRTEQVVCHRLMGTEAKCKV